VILLIDSGNTAIKWRTYDADFILLNKGSILHADLGVFLVGDSWAKIKQVYIADVTAGITERLVLYFDAEVDIYEIQSAKKLLGVVNSYEEPARLGVDRLLSVAQGYHMAGKACCVIDLGTAAKADVVDDDGYHQGGFIVPGLALAEKALLANTGKVRFSDDEAGFGVTSFGVGTAEAVRHGNFVMILAWINATVNLFKALCPNGVVYLQGGDAGLFISESEHKMEQVQDLVLEALLRIAKELTLSK